MNFAQACEKMLQGFKMTHKTWLKNDYIYIENNVIMCDGNFEFATYLRRKELSSTGWKIFKEKEVNL